MNSLSDNTAADMLTGLVGLPVEDALTATGMTSPALDRPVLTTREIYVLKLDHCARNPIPNNLRSIQPLCSEGRFRAVR